MVASRGVNIARPRTATRSLSVADICKAYNFPPHTGTGRTVAIIELGGAVNKLDLMLADVPRVKVIPVDGAVPKSDGPDGADGEVMLDVEVVLEAAPGCAVRVYFGPNTDQGFYDCFAEAIKDLKAGDAISCSWGGPENAWDTATMREYDGLFAAARAKGINVFCASGDTGSSDSGGVGNHVDFPASSPNVVACGGTRLTVNPDGSRSTETTWNDDPQRSATGGGDSAVFLGRAVPDIAGNADPQTGYQVTVDDEQVVIGGTSAVAPLMAALAVRLTGAAGPFDFQKAITANPEVCFDVTAGDNGAFRAGPGRDKVTGFGVPDGSRLLGVLSAGTVPPAPTPVPVPVPPVSTDPLAGFPFVELDIWSGHLRPWWSRYQRVAVAAYKTWRNSVKG